MFKSIGLAIGVSLALLAGHAAAKQPLKIGVLSDMTAVTADIAGEGSVIAAQMAVEDMQPTMKDWKIEVISGDFQFKPDLAATIATQWFDRDGVDVIVDVPNAASALAVQDLAIKFNKIGIYSGAGTPKLYTTNCSPNGFMWMNDQYSHPNALVIGLKELDLKKWFFFTGDFAGGIASEEAMRSLLAKTGVEVVGGVRAPMQTTDFSAYMLQVQAANADAVVVTFGGAPTVRALQGLKEFGIKAKVLLPSYYINDAKAMGLETAQGIYFAESFYWDQNDETRAWSQRFFERAKKMPSSIQAGVYTGVLHYLKAVKETGTTSGKEVGEKMRALPINDFITKDGKAEANGLVMRDRHLWQVKAPGESTGEWDLYKFVKTVPGKEAALPLSESGCSLVK